VKIFVVLGTLLKVIGICKFVFILWGNVGDENVRLVSVGEVEVKLNVLFSCG